MVIKIKCICDLLLLGGCTCTYPHIMSTFPCCLPLGSALWVLLQFFSKWCLVCLLITGGGKTVREMSPCGKAGRLGTRCLVCSASLSGRKRLTSAFVLKVLSLVSFLQKGSQMSPPLAGMIPDPLAYPLYSTVFFFFQFVSTVWFFQMNCLLAISQTYSQMQFWCGPSQQSSLGGAMRPLLRCPLHLPVASNKANKRGSRPRSAAYGP